MKPYQFDFSDMHREVYFDIENRTVKARKILAILRDYLGEDLSEKSVLDIGCSTGVMCQIMSDHFGTVRGIDIDEKAIAFACDRFASERVNFALADAMDSKLAADQFDVVLCAHVYEHVPNPYAMLAEIRRVLKPGGVCYFAAENRIIFREGDYRLPFLSVLPKRLANIYVRLAGKGQAYYETLFTLGQLRRLVKDFETIDYTGRVVESPDRFNASDIMPTGSRRQFLAKLVIRYAYWLFPTYLWLLRKNI